MFFLWFLSSLQQYSSCSIQFFARTQYQKAYHKQLIKLDLCSFRIDHNYTNTKPHTHKCMIFEYVDILLKRGNIYEKEVNYKLVQSLDICSFLDFDR